MLAVLRGATSLKVAYVRRGAIRVKADRGAACYLEGA